MTDIEVSVEQDEAGVSKKSVDTFNNFISNKRCAIFIIQQPNNLYILLHLAISLVLSFLFDSFVGSFLLRFLIWFRIC